MKTREEQNKRRRDLRFQAKSGLYQTLKSAIEFLWLRAAKEHWPSERIFKYRNETMPIVSGDSRKLPWIWRAQLDGVADAMLDLHYRCLTFCYAHPDTGIITPADVLCKAGLASRIDSTTGAHYYRNDDGTFSDAFNADVATGEPSTGETGETAAGRGRPRAGDLRHNLDFICDFV